MLVVFELVSGPNVGAWIEARSGDVVEVGRAARVGRGVVQDPHMSARHFAIACDDGQCRIRGAPRRNRGLRQWNGPACDQHCRLLGG